jgi:hypothetical protein
MRIHIGAMSIILFLSLFSVDTVFAASAPNNIIIARPATLSRPSFDSARLAVEGRTPLLLSASYQVTREGGSDAGGADQEIVVILGTIVLLLAIIILRLRTTVREVPVPAADDSMLQTQPGHDEGLPEELEPESPLEDEELESEPTLYGRLYVLRGLEDSEIPITCEEFTIGRASDNVCDYGIDQPYVSPRHCAVSFRSGAFIIKDLGSKNGTYVNGERLPREREVIVPVGSEIEITKNIALEIWDPETVVDVDREVVTSEQEFSTHGDDELIFQPLPGIAYADDTEGAISDDYTPI